MVINDNSSDNMSQQHAEDWSRGLALLARAGQLLAESLDYRTTLENVARLVVSEMADWCIVYSIDGDEGSLKRVAVTHADPADADLARELLEAPLPGAARIASIIEHFRNHEPVVDNNVGPEWFDAAADNPAYRAVLERMGITSSVGIPLNARGRFIGVIALISTTSRRIYSQSDVALAMELGQRAALAVDNALLYRAAQEEIAERRRAEEERNELLLREQQSRRELEQLLEKMQKIEVRVRRLYEANVVGIFFSSLDGAIIDANDAFLTMLGYTNQELASGQLNWWQLTPAEYESVTTNAVQELRQLGVCTPFEKEYLRRDGSRVAVLIGGALIEGTPDMEVAFVIDISERKNAEIELQRAKEDAEKANHAKDQFLAVLSHELRTPLTPVIVAVQALREEGVPEHMESFIDVIDRNVQIEARLIDDLLDLSRIEHGKLQLQRESIDVHQLLEAVIAGCQSDIETKHLQLVVELNAAKHTAFADPARLQQVFWNLLKNAVKFTPEGGKIIVATESLPDSMMRITVADTGIGIDSDVLPRIFNAFEQGEQSITRRFGGMGLGLAISSMLVGMHGGQLSAVSDGAGHGSSFIVELAAIESQASVSATGHPPNGRGHEQRGIRVLIVEDHTDTGTVLRMMLERDGYLVQSASNMNDAMQFATTTQFDLLISDIGLPDGTGIELMEKLGERRPPKAIALSGFGMEDDVRRSREVGFAEHLTKPVNVTRLREVIEQLFS
jgi:PAS domain S-box-containing protein